mgnify:FL=1
MNILITGSNGFIGKNLSQKLKKKYEIYYLTRSKFYSRKKNKIKCDLLKKNHINLLMKEKLKLDIIIHAASKLASSSNLENISLIKNNILIYENLSLVINKFNPKQVINLSSIAIYPNKDGVYDETSQVRPSINNDCLYGLSKFIGENILDFKCSKSNILNLRIAQVYGSGMRSDRIYEIMKKQLKDKNTINVYGMGRRVSGFIHIDSLVSKIKFCIKKKLDGIFNIGDENLSYKQLAKKIIIKYGNINSQIKFLDKGVNSKTFINFKKLKRMEKKN